MAAPLAAAFNKCQFISAEINHDFYSSKRGPRLNEYQDGCWNINTLCNHADVAQRERNAGSEGDDQLVGQIFGQIFRKGVPVSVDGVAVSAVSKPILKKLTPGEYMISAVVSPTINLSAPLPQPGVSIAQALTPEPQMMQVPMYVAHANINATDPRGIYGVFKYPDENFLIIDAVPTFVTSILKYLRFPETVDSSTMALEKYTAYTNMTTQQLCSAPYWPKPPAVVRWPFRPKINVINTPNTLGDPQPTCDPGSTKFSINERLRPQDLTSNTSAIPGGLDNKNQSCPLIYTWYYTQPEVSVPNNPLMMSRYKIKMGPIGTGYGYKQSQNWTDAAPGDFIGPPGDGAAKENAIGSLKKKMLAEGITQDPPRQGTTRERYNVPAAKMAKASLLVQRKRSGDYLQMKTAYEFPALAAARGGDRAIYEMILGPQGAMDLGATSTLSGDGNFKTEPRPTRNTQWYRNRTYFCTQDWPAFCYATYNKINCILICKRKGCAAGSGAPFPNTNLIYRNYFGT
jgi:hypothetical protein